MKERGRVQNRRTRGIIYWWKEFVVIDVDKLPRNGNQLRAIGNRKSVALDCAIKSSRL